MGEVTGQEAVDNIEAQLDMAVDAADDIGFDDEEVVADAEMGANEETVAGDDQQVTQQATQQTTSDSGGSESGAQETRAAQNPDDTATGQNERGDLVNAAGGVVAERGAERRVYERSNKIQQDNIELQRKMGDMQRQLEDNNQFSSQPAKLSLSNQEAETGMQLMHQLKTDPVAAARQILQSAVSKGYNIQDIIGTAHGQASPVNMGAIEQMISEKLAPITQREEGIRAQEQERQDAERGKAAFISKHEFSEIHLDPITTLLQNNPTMSPEQAYYEVKTYALSNNLDFTQPLAQQVHAKNGANNTNTNQPNRPMPNGNGASTVVTQSPQQANGDDDWDSIVRKSMVESGVQF